MRRRLRNSDQKPSRNRSSAERLGARRRERLITRSCCFMSRLSATTALAPPGPRSLAIVVNRCARSTSRSFMAEQGREACFHEQDCPSCIFQVIISNSPTTADTVAICEPESAPRAGVAVCGERLRVGSLRAAGGVFCMEPRVTGAGERGRFRTAIYGQVCRSADCLHHSGDNYCTTGVGQNTSFTQCR
jgi:hypothetical protein